MAEELKAALAAQLACRRRLPRVGGSSHILPKQLVAPGEQADSRGTRDGRLHDGVQCSLGKPATAGRLHAAHSHVCRAHLTQRVQPAHLRSAGRQPVRCAAETAEAGEAPAEQSSQAASGIKSLGPDLWNTTYYPKGAHTDPNLKDWYVIDAAGQALGRLATHAATHIRGKHVPTFTNSMDMGSYVVVINAEQVAIGGRKYTDKMYYRVTGRPGAMKTESFAHLQKRIPERIVEQAIKGMLPKGRLGRRLFTHLKVYKGSKHPHTAQQPVDITTRINTKPSFQG